MRREGASIYQQPRGSCKKKALPHTTTTCPRSCPHRRSTTIPVHHPSARAWRLQRDTLVVRPRGIGSALALALAFTVAATAAPFKFDTDARGATIRDVPGVPSRSARGADGERGGNIFVGRSVTALGETGCTADTGVDSELIVDGVSAVLGDTGDTLTASVPRLAWSRCGSDS